MARYKNIYGITLIELLITVILIGMLVLALVSIQRFSVHHMIASERRAKLQNEGYIILEQMTKSLLNATGDIINPAVRIYPNPTGIAIRVDRNNPPTPQNYSDDNITAYRNNTGYRLEYCDGLTGSTYPATLNSAACPTGGWQEILNRLRDFAITTADNNTTIVINFSIVRYDPANPQTSEDNPEVNMTTRVHMPSASGN